MTTAWANRLLTVDLHAGQIQGFFDIPTDNLLAATVLSRDIEQKYGTENVVIVSPDVGGVVRARSMARRLHVPLAIIDKRRDRAGGSEVMNVIGDVQGLKCILVDDMADSAGTLCNAAAALVEKGAKSVAAYVTHHVLSGGALETIAKSPLTELVGTNTIQSTPEAVAAPKFREVSITPLLAEAIRCIHEEKSVSRLFD